ncbi:MAG: hypothetical protein KA066_01895 [Candidatus Pacebacteria bacterium]|nr:hypothetical protein [Candidatus Paceibacterota bacterium]
MNKNALIWALVVAVFATGAYFLLSNSTASLPGDTAATTTPQTALEQYSSEDGYSFMYPNTYELSSRTEGNAERQWDVLVLLPKGYVPPQNGEGPPAISLSVFSNTEGLSLDAWVQGDARSNWKLIVDERASRPMTVGGEPALWYHYSGLYEVDSVAVAHGGKIFLFSGDWLDPSDQIRADFNNLIKTVQFSDAS